jgi:hypothetical protein
MAIPGAAGSPYHSLPAVKAASPNDKQVEQVRYPSVPAGEDLVPPVAALGGPTRPAIPADPVPIAVPVVEAKPKPVEDAPVIMALRCLLNKRPAEAVAWVERYDKPSQELLLFLLPLAARLTEGGLQKADPAEVAHVVDQLEIATNELRPRAALTIEKMCFCWHIKEFGVYRPLPSDPEFRPGELVQIYAELQNFTDEPHGNLHRVRLASTLEIREFNGSKVWRRDYHDRDTDVSQSRRHDLIGNYTFQVPRIPPGLYILSLEVTDVPTRRTVEKTLDFRVVPARGL